TADMVMLSTTEPEPEKEKAATKVSDNPGNGNSVNYKTLVGELKADLKNGASAEELVTHWASLPVSPQEKMSAL
ncbi:eukaryotic translation initiation factor 5-like, partial [Trifolium medium]|nr:eukaryotic translation initiation factor 5-like [Trifolium medium]